MNVKIKEQNLCFKISEIELNTLLKGHSVHAKVVLLGHTMVIAINPNGENDRLMTKLVLDQSEAYLNLIVSHRLLKELESKGRSREGVHQIIDDVTISLQVDVRKDARKAKSR